MRLVTYGDNFLSSGSLVLASSQNTMYTSGSLPSTILASSLSSSTPQDVATTGNAGAANTTSHSDHAHRGVAGIYTSPNTDAFGSVALVGGSNVTITQSSGSFTFGLSAPNYASMYANDITQTVTISAPDTYAEVGGSMTSGSTSADFTFQSSKQLLCNTTGLYHIDYHMTVEPASGAAVHIEGAVMINATGMIQSASATHCVNSSDEQPVGGSIILTVNSGDVVKLCVKEESGSINVVVTHANLTILRIR